MLRDSDWNCAGSEVAARPEDVSLQAPGATRHGPHIEEGDQARLRNRSWEISPVPLLHSPPPHQLSDLHTLRVELSQVSCVPPPKINVADLTSTSQNVTVFGDKLFKEVKLK